MSVLQLTRIPGEGRLYAREGVGRLRVSARRMALGSCRARRGKLEDHPPRHLRPVVEAAGAAGVVGAFDGRALHRGGVLRWCDRQLALRGESLWHEQYAIVEATAASRR